jgi:hypothetical protein
MLLWLLVERPDMVFLALALSSTLAITVLITVTLTVGLQAV